MQRLKVNTKSKAEIRLNILRFSLKNSDQIVASFYVGNVCKITISSFLFVYSVIVVCN